MDPKDQPFKPPIRIEIADFSKYEPTAGLGLTGPGYVYSTTYADGRKTLNVFTHGMDAGHDAPISVIPNGVDDDAKTAWDKDHPNGPTTTTANGQRLVPDGNGGLTSIGTAGDPSTLETNAENLRQRKQNQADGKGFLTDKEIADAAAVAADKSHDNQHLDTTETRLAQAALDAEANRKLALQQAQQTLALETDKLGLDKDKLLMPQAGKDGNWYQASKDENGTWLIKKVEPVGAQIPKGSATEFGDNLQNIKLGVASQAMQKYQTDLLKRVESTDPNVHISMADAEKLMTAFIAHGESYLKEQQGILGEQARVQTNQLTQRNQDLQEVQSRRNFAQTNMADAVKHSEAVNTYLPAGQGNLAGPAFLGQMALANMNAGGVGGFTPVAPVPMTPMQQQLMQIPASFAHPGITDQGPVPAGQTQPNWANIPYQGVTP